jgi:hypothetical protein
MIQRDKPTLPYAEAGPTSVAFSDNPMPNHVCSNKMRYQRTRSCWENRHVAAAYQQNPVRSAHQNSQP